VTSQHFVGYLSISPVSKSRLQPNCGLIISKSVGGSVIRHRVARQIRHAVAPHMPSLPAGSLLVIRALTQQGDTQYRI
jgi:ribonuclease P protein component